MRIFFFSVLLLATSVLLLASAVAEGQALSLTITTTAPTCLIQFQPTTYSAIGNGSITAVASGGTPPYTYSITLFRAAQSSGYFPGMDEGNYDVTVTDAAGATKVQEVQLFYSLPQPTMVLNVLQLPSSCTSADGSIEMTAGNGTPPYTYSTDGGLSYQSSNLATGLQQGAAYEFAVKDANGCLTDANTGGSRGDPAFFVCFLCCSMQIDGLVTTLGCNNGGGTLDVWDEADPGPIYWSLDGVNYTVANQPGQNENIFSNLPAGVYHVHVKNASGTGSGQETFTILEACANYVNLITIAPGCHQNNGSITVNAQFGQSPYTYSIDGINYQNSNVFSGLAAGAYSITTKDATGATMSSNAVLTLNCPAVTATATPPTCGNQDGTITAQGTGGTLPFQYSLDGVHFQTNAAFTGLAAGNYTVTIQDGAGNTAQVSVVVAAATCLQVTATPVSGTCGNPNGSITAAASNGTPPYTYSLDGINYSTAATFTGLAAGVYLVHVKDAGSGTGSAPVTLTNIPGPRISGITTTAFCEYGSGTMTVNADGGTAPLQYSADNGAGYQPGNVFDGVTAGSYTVDVLDANGCVATATQAVTALPMPVLALGTDTTPCDGDPVVLNATNTGAVYLWQDGSTQPTYNVTGDGKYTVTVSLNGCDTTASITVHYMSRPVIHLTPDTTLCVLQQWLIDVSYPQATYLWQDGTTSPQYKVTTGGVYTVSVTNGCGSATATTDVVYKACNCNFYVPSAFTPNGDGVNDIFKPGYACLYSHYAFTVFNRWGQAVFTTTNPDKGWDGRWNGRDQIPGTYVWMMTYEDTQNGTVVKQQGTVELMR